MLVTAIVFLLYTVVALVCLVFVLLLFVVLGNDQRGTNGE